MKKSIAYALVVMILTMMIGCAVAENADQTAEEAVAPSITVAQLVAPENVTYEEDFVIYVEPPKPESVETVVFEEIVAFVEEEKVTEYFGEEVMEAAVEYLPEEVDPETLEVEEFFALEEEGYKEEYGEIKATFELAAEYDAEVDVVLAMIGILPEGMTNEEAKEAAAEMTEAAEETEEAAEETEEAAEEIEEAEEAAEETEEAAEETEEAAEVTEETEEAAEETEEAAEEEKILWIPQRTDIVDGKIEVVFDPEVIEMMANRNAVMVLLRSYPAEAETEAETEAAE